MDVTNEAEGRYAASRVGSGARSSSTLQDQRSTPMTALCGRINEARQRVLDATATARRHADTLVGEEPPRPTGRTDEVKPHPGVDGIIGSAHHELSALEDAIDTLSEQVARLNCVS